MSLGGTLAEIQRFRAEFDYISRADQRSRGRPDLAGLINDLLQYFHVSGPLSSGTTSFIAASLPSSSRFILVAEHQGRCESSEKALHIMSWSP